jgi:hypothetical protein
MWKVPGKIDKNHIFNFYRLLRIMKFKLSLLILGIISLSISCTDYHNQVHVDEPRNIIVPCDGGYLNNVRVKTSEFEVTYEGVDTIFFNKASRASIITVDGKIDSNYILKLEPNTTYTINTRSPNHDQSPWIKIIKTDNKGVIIHDLKNSECN